jgi:hypothetical protein
VKIRPDTFLAVHFDLDSYDLVPGSPRAYRLTRRATKTAKKSWPPTPSMIAKPRATSVRGTISP